MMSVNLSIHLRLNFLCFLESNQIKAIGCWDHLASRSRTLLLFFPFFEFERRGEERKVWWVWTREHRFEFRKCSPKEGCWVFIEKWCLVQRAMTLISVVGQLSMMKFKRVHHGCVGPIECPSAWWWHVWRGSRTNSCLRRDRPSTIHTILVKP